MCEMLLRVRDKDSKTIDQRLMQHKPGDVVVVVEDGHVWGRMEIGSPDHRVLRLPGLPAAAMSDMMATRANSLNGATTAKKARYFDISDEWLRGILAAGQVIELTDADAARLMSLRRIRNDDLPMMVG